MATAPITIKDDDLVIATFTRSINFTGAGVMATTDAQGNIEVKVNDAGASPIIEDVQAKNEGTTIATKVRSLDFIGSGVNATSDIFGNVQVSVAGEPIAVLDEGVERTPALSSIDFAGPAVSVATLSPGNVRVTVGGEPIAVLDEGVERTAALSSINFTGPAVSVTTLSPGNVQVAIDAEDVSVTAGAGITVATPSPGVFEVTNADRGSVAVAAHEALADPHPQYLTQAEGDTRYAAFGTGAGASTFINKKLTATQANNTLTPADITELVTPLIANAVYRVTAFITFRSAATTTGAAIGFTSPAGTINQLEVVVPITSVAASTQLRKIFPTAAEVVTGEVLGTGVTAINSDHTAMIHGLIYVGPTPGDWAPRFRSEVNGSAITLQIGSSILFERVA